MDSGGIVDIHLRRLAARGIFEGGGNVNIADFDGLNGDAPRVGLLVEDALQFVAERIAFRDRLRQFVAAGRFA